MSSTTRKLGAQAEQQAVAFLRQQGLVIKATNYTVKGGEIDIIAQDKNALVCIEVKARSRADYGIAQEMVSKTKLKRMLAAFSRYLIDNKLNPSTTDLRVDVVAINKGAVSWIKNVVLDHDHDYRYQW